MDESSRMVLCRRQGRERQAQQLGIRDGQSEWTDAGGLDEEFDETRRFGHGRRESREGWKQSCECEISRFGQHRSEDVRRFQSRAAIMKVPTALVVVMIACSGTLSAQWPKYQEAGVPRDSEG